MKRRWFILVAAGLLIIGLLYNYFGPSGITDLAHESVRLELQAIGRSIYEFHEKTGRWPSRPEDLDQTLIAARSPYWKATIANGSVVIVWHDDLKPHPIENSGAILAYHNKGLIAWMGRHWVCWGDLRTEYITDELLKASLNAAKK